MGIQSIDDVVYDNADVGDGTCESDVNNNCETNVNNKNSVKDSNDNSKNSFPSEYFVIPNLDNIPKNMENMDEILLDKFNQLGVRVKYHYKSTNIYCVVIENVGVLKELESLDYVILERVGEVRALNSEH